MKEKKKTKEEKIAQIKRLIEEKKTKKEAIRSNLENKRLLRQYEKGFYDLQKLRISTGNRLAMNLIVRLGIEPGKKLDTEEDPVAKYVLDLAVEEYKRVADFVAVGGTKRIKEYLSENPGILDDVSDYYLIQTYNSLLEREASLKCSLEEFLPNINIWNSFLKDVSGCGPLMGSVIISEFDIHKCHYVSSMWKYAGLDVREVFHKDGTVTNEGVCKKKKFFETINFIDKFGDEATREGLTYNLFLKTKLFVLATSFIRGYGKIKKYYEGEISKEEDPEKRAKLVREYNERKASHYGRVYYDTHNRETQKRQIHLDSLVAEGKPLKEAEKEARPIPKQIDLRSKRKMIKIFLRDLYIYWKKVEGLPYVDPYEIRVLGMAPHKMANGSSDDYSSGLSYIGVQS